MTFQPCTSTHCSATTPMNEGTGCVRWLRKPPLGHLRSSSRMPQGPTASVLVEEAGAEGHLQAIHALASGCDDPGEKLRWLRTAAGEGHVPAMYDLRLATDDLRERERWLGLSYYLTVSDSGEIIESNPPLTKLASSA